MRTRVFITNATRKTKLISKCNFFFSLFERVPKVKKKLGKQIAYID